MSPWDFRAKDQVDVVALTCQLVDIDSTTGQEGEAARVLAALLRDRGYQVHEQEVAGERINVYAHLDVEPVVVFSTHIDCVPPFFPSRIDRGRLYGRGACDAKGVAAAQVAAVERLRAAGERRVGLLFVAGEERGSDGAKRANQDPPPNVRYLVDGEPTDSRLGTATRGVLRVRLSAAGRSAHSAYPELGESAIHKLLEALTLVRGMAWPEDEVLGRTTYHVGLIQGGIAPNVLAPFATAELMFRTVGPSAQVLASFERLSHIVRVEVLLDLPATRLTIVEGFEAVPFAFGTDIPMLTNWGAPLLFGPGSIHVAHTAEEHVVIDELESSVDGYVAIARQLLAGA